VLPGQGLTQVEKLEAMLGRVALFGNLSVTWSPGDDRNSPELVAVMADRIRCRQRLTEYSWRMCIEESFRDDQSSGG
jgi:hypothetical protein